MKTTLLTFFIVLLTGATSILVGQCLISGPATLEDGETGTYCTNCTAQCYYWSSNNSNLQITGSNTGSCVTVTSNGLIGPANLDLTLFDNGLCYTANTCTVTGVIPCQPEASAFATPGCWPNSTPRWKIVVTGQNGCQLTNIDEVCFQSNDATFANYNDPINPQACGGQLIRFFHPVNQVPGSLFYQVTINITVSFTDGRPDVTITHQELNIPRCLTGHIPIFIGPHRRVIANPHEENLSVYPSPATDKITIGLNLEKQTSEISIELHDIVSGKSAVLDTYNQLDAGNTNVQYQIPEAFKGKTILLTIKSKDEVIARQKLVTIQ